jgi:hypothetical protein
VHESAYILKKCRKNKPGTIADFSHRDEKE